MSRTRGALGGALVVSALLVGACGGDDEVVWDLREPTTAGDLGARGTVVTHEGAASYTVRLPGREIAGAFRSIDGLSDPARRAEHGGAIDTLTLRYPFATTAEAVAEHVVDIESIFAIEPERQAALDAFVERVRSSAAANDGRIDVADFEPGTSRERLSTFAITTGSGLVVDLLVSTMDTDTMALTLMIEFDPRSPTG